MKAVPTTKAETAKSARLTLQDNTDNAVKDKFVALCSTGQGSEDHM